jgi:hypothetical protein
MEHSSQLNEQPTKKSVIYLVNQRNNWAIDRIISNKSWDHPTVWLTNTATDKPAKYLKVEPNTIQRPASGLDGSAFNP